MALENPPLHVACDTHIFRIETRWTNEVPAIYEFELEELADPVNFARLRDVFHNPDALRSGRTREKLTKEAADNFQAISDRLQHRNPDREAVAHFVNQLVFCFFADSVKLLPEGLWKKLLKFAERKPDQAKVFLARLFDDMAKGGDFDLETILEFDGGLFDGRPPLALEFGEIGLLFAAASLDWSLIDPTIFGTLFERFLDPDKRAQIGAHYTDPTKIMMIVEPVVLRPLKAEWEATKARIEAIMAPALEAGGGNGKGAKRDLGKKFEAARAKAEAERDAFIDRLCRLRILDPACGSGNFLYLALQGVKDIEWRVILDSEALGLGMVVPCVGPEILHGIEINPFAAELARTTIWIGDIQWRVKNAIQHHPRPILRKLDAIECRDALLTPDGQDGFVEAEWPEADVIVGNPPFLGAKLMKRKLGVDITDAVRSTYAGRLPGFTDLVCYWFEKGRALIEAGKVSCVGLVATNSIRKNTNLPVMQRIAATTRIFEAWSEEKWSVAGAMVDVSLICFGDNGSGNPQLNGEAVAGINPDLTSGLDVTRARPLPENAEGAFLGIQKSGPFDVPGTLARVWMAEPLNPNGRSNAEVLKPYWNGDDLTGRPRDIWFIDLPLGLFRAEAAQFASPFKHIETAPDEEGKLIHELRAALGERAGPPWWEPHWPRPEMRSRIERLSRYIVTGETAEYRLFAWLAYPVLPDKNLVVITREDDLTFGLLQNRFHEAWALRKGSDLQDRPRYTHTTTFATYPFPEGLTPNIPATDTADDPRAQRIAAAAKTLDDLRRAWLNPPDLVDIVPEVTPTAAPGEAPRRYPDRILPKTVEAAAKLKERTLTNLYNQRPRWLIDAHDALDRAVAAAYGWPENISTDDALARLLALNLERAGKQK